MPVMPTEQNHPDHPDRRCGTCAWSRYWKIVVDAGTSGICCYPLPPLPTSIPGNTDPTKPIARTLIQSTDGSKCLCWLGKEYQSVAGDIVSEQYNPVED